MNEIERLQDNLLLIRRAAGWTAEEFGKKSVLQDRQLIILRQKEIS